MKKIRAEQDFFRSTKIKRSMKNASFRKGVEEEFFMLEIADSLAALRHQARLSQRGLAKKAGINQQEICEIENGRRNITARTISRIAKSLGYKPEISFHHA